MKKALFALMLGLAAAPAAWACALNDMNCQGWYHNEYLPQQQQRAQQQYVPVQYESRYGTIVQSSDGAAWGVNDYPSRETADSDALAGCQKRVAPGVRCTIAWRYANTCMALTSNSGILYTGNGLSTWKAKRMAMKKCKAESGNPSACEHYMAECSLPVRIN